MPYRSDVPALEERRSQLWRELERARKHRADLAHLAAREKSIEAELRDVEKRLGAASREKSILDDIRIASPCKASWDDMVGDERVRFCGQCAKNVYNLSAMERAEAEALLVATEGKVCVRLARRADGTVVTNDCPVGAKKKKRVRLAVLSVAGAGALACAAAAGTTTTLGGVHHTVGEMAPRIQEPITESSKASTDAQTRARQKNSDP